MSTTNYSYRKLYNIETKTSDEHSNSYESLWAYTIKYPQAEHSIPGRYRIRISRMTSDEFLALMGAEIPDDIPVDFSVQAYLEKWSDKGWIHCLDWMGKPDSSNNKIEQDLNEMYKSFTTGKPTNKQYEVDLPASPPIPPKPRGKPKFSIVDGGKQDDTKTKKDQPDGFDWI
jgi:hypothetical protein